MFSGIGKTAAELALALDEDILCVNVESEPELELLSAHRCEQGPHGECLGARQSRRRCQDPRQDRHRQSENKFGIPISRARDDLCQGREAAGLRVVGVDMHIGSQITELSPFDDAFALLSDFVRELRADGHTISHVDLGGGLGIPYREDNEPPPDPVRLCGGGQARDARARLQADLRARAG